MGGYSMKFTPVFPFKYHSINAIFIYMFFLQAAQMGEAWDPSEKQSSVGNMGTMVTRVLQIFSSL
jgi:hypothetical protein